jgi:cell division septation protein DedD
MNNENQPAKKGEFMMIAVAAVLAFGLTVTGVVYLAKYLIGTPPANTPTVPKMDEEVVVRYSIEPEDSSALIITDTDASRDNETGVSFGFKPIGLIPQTPAAAPTEPAETSQTPTPPAVSAPVTQTPPAVTPPQIAVAPPAYNSGRYQLQLYAFSAKDTADREAARLKAEYPDIYVVRAEVNNRTWFRVRCCRTDSKTEAARIRDEITAKYKEISPDIIGN